RGRCRPDQAHSGSFPLRCLPEGSERCERLAVHALGLEDRYEAPGHRFYLARPTFTSVERGEVKRNERRIEDHPKLCKVASNPGERGARPFHPPAPRRDPSLRPAEPEDIEPVAEAARERGHLREQSAGLSEIVEINEKQEKVLSEAKEEPGLSFRIDE